MIELSDNVQLLLTTCHIENFKHQHEKKMFNGITNLTLRNEFSFANLLKYLLNAAIGMPGNC